MVVEYFCLGSVYIHIYIYIYSLQRQGQIMIESSSKLYHCGDNVRIPIPTVDRDPIGPTSLIGTVTNVNSSGSVFLVGTKHGRKETSFPNSDVSHCCTSMFLLLTDIPDR